MIVRFALVGLAVAGLASPAAAVEMIAEATRAQNDTDRGKSADVARLFTKDGATAQKLASIAPPPRPGDLIVQGSAP